MHHLRHVVQQLGQIAHGRRGLAPVVRRCDHLRRHQLCKVGVKRRLCAADDFLTFEIRRTVDRFAVLLDLKMQMRAVAVARIAHIADGVPGFDLRALADGGGDAAIRPEDFESDLKVTLEGAREVVSASWTANRPTDLDPTLEVQGVEVLVSPHVFNPGDMLELQVISSGPPRTVGVTGRVADLTIKKRVSLPYPPGSGSEGEMLGFDQFVWFIFVPGFIVGLGLLAAFQDGITGTQQAVIAIATSLLLLAYLVQTRYLVRRRRRWRP